MRVNDYIERFEDELIVAFENQAEYQHFIPFAQECYEEFMDNELEIEILQGGY